MLARTVRSAAGLSRVRFCRLQASPRCAIRFASVKVKVPQMAESISEGTLKQFSKGVGDFVNADDELATIETDKVCIPLKAHPHSLCLRKHHAFKQEQN